MFLRFHRIPAASIFWAWFSCFALAICADSAVAQSPDNSPAIQTEPNGPAAPAESPAAGTADTNAPAANLPIAASVVGIPIYQRDVDAALGDGKQYEPNMLPTIRASILEQLITKVLVESYLASQKVTVSKEELDAAVDRLKGALKEQKSTFEGFLSRMHLTEPALRATMSRELVWRKYVSQNETDDNLRALFKALHEQFDGTERRVSHILLRPEAGIDPSNPAAVREQTLKLREQAIKLRDDITAGRISFESAAEKYSAGPSRHQKGDLGFIPPQGIMAPDFSQTAFALQPGEISQPVITPFGIHLIKVTEIKPGTKSFEDVNEAVKSRFPDLLYRQVISLLRQKYADKIEYNENFPHFKPGTTELASSPAVGSS